MAQDSGNDVLSTRPIGFDNIADGELSRDFADALRLCLRSFSDPESEGKRSIVVKIDLDDKGGSVGVSYSVEKKIPTKAARGGCTAIRAGGPGQYVVFEAQQQPLFAPVAVASKE